MAVDDRAANAVEVAQGRVLVERLTVQVAPVHGAAVGNGKALDDARFAINELYGFHPLPLPYHARPGLTPPGLTRPSLYTPCLTIPTAKSKREVELMSTRQLRNGKRPASIAHEPLSLALPCRGPAVTRPSPAAAYQTSPDQTLPRRGIAWPRLARSLI